MTEDLHVLLADDDKIIREGLANLLDHQEGISVRGVAPDGKAALRILAKQKIDVALLDVDMPVMDGIQAAKEIGRLYPQTTVVMLTAFEHEDSLAKSLAQNVRGFLTKDIPAAELAELLKRAHSGQTVMGPRPTEILAQSFLSSGQNSPEYEDFRQKIEQLPSYLRATFDMLILGLPNKAIARDLNLSETTVRSYISELFTVTGYTNRGELAITAIKAGFR